MKKRMGYYMLAAAGLIIGLGALTWLLGSLLPLSEESCKNTVETVSSFLGSIYVAFFLGRIRDGNWEDKREKEEKKRYCIYGILLFLGRTAGRLVISLFRLIKITGVGVFLSIVLELSALILIYLHMPAKQAGGAAHE